MVKAYADQIIAHRKTIDDVPARLREKVLEELKKRGYDGQGNPIPPNNDIES